MLLTIQQQYVTDVAMTCYSLRLRRSFSFAFFAVRLCFSRYIIAKNRVAWAEGRAG